MRVTAACVCVWRQGWHIDSTWADGIKVQVPLTDVDATIGAVEFNPGSQNKTCRDDTYAALENNHSTICPIALGAVRQGSAILYVHRLHHRGAGNRNPEGTPDRDRPPVVDFSFMSKPGSWKYNYTDGFRPVGIEQLERLRDVYASYVKLAGLQVLEEASAS